MGSSVISSYVSIMISTFPLTVCDDEGEIIEPIGGVMSSGSLLSNNIAIGPSSVLLSELS